MPRFYIGKWAGEKSLWNAANATAEGNFLITFDFAFDAPGDDIGKRYRAALAKLGEGAREQRELSAFTWLFGLDAKLNEVFQIMVDQIGVDYHSYTAVDLNSGDGLAYDADKRVVCEFYSRHRMD
jgi:hypothetical protein